jgi:pyrimidine oxygenase
MKFGLFLPSSRSNIASTAVTANSASYSFHRQVVTEAEELGWDFALAAVKLRGVGGASHFWDEFLDSFTLITGLAEATAKIQLYASAGILTMPPPLTARMAMTLEQVSNGRCGVNIVTGWSPEEYGQMGIWPGDDYLSRRYDQAAEYVTIMRELWATGRSDFSGRYYQMNDCVLGPTPEHEIPLLNAGSSPSGLAFAANHVDMAFFHSRGRDEAGLAHLRDDIARLNKVSADAGRQVSPYVALTIILDETDELAEARSARIRDGFDEVAWRKMTGVMSVDQSKGGNAERVANVGEGPDNRAFFNSDVITGSAATVAAEINRMASEVPGIGGLVVGTDDFLGTVRRFGRDVIPLLSSEARQAASLT